MILTKSTTAFPGARGYLAAMIAALVSLAPTATHACSVCFGDPEAPETKAMAAGILFMLGCIGTVLASFASVFVYWIYRSYRLAGDGNDPAARRQELLMANEGATN